MRFMLFLLSILHLSFAFAQRMDVIQERQSSRSFRYLVPNELYPEKLYEKNLSNGKLGGVVISVGTLRSFYTAGAQRASELDIVDYDENIQNFNRLHVEILKHASDRFEYLAEFFGTEADPALVNQVKAGKIGFDRYVYQTLFQPVNSSLPPYLEEFQTLLSHSRFDGGTSSLRQGFKKHFEAQAQRKQGTEAFFWINDAVYSHLRNLALTDRINIIRGSWSGTTTLQSLAKSLRASNSEVRVVDLSNLMEWLHTRAIDSKTEQPLILFQKNIRALPLSEDAVFQFTMGNSKLGSKNEGLPKDAQFTYATLGRDPFLKEVVDAKNLASEAIIEVLLGNTTIGSGQSPKASKLHRLFGNFASGISRCFLK